MYKWPMYGPRFGGWLWERGVGRVEGGQRGKNWDNCNRINKKEYKGTNKQTDQKKVFSLSKDIHKNC